MGECLLGIRRGAGASGTGPALGPSLAHLPSLLTPPKPGFPPALLLFFRPCLQGPHSWAGQWGSPPFA